MAKRKKVELADSERTVELINWIIFQATTRNGTALVHDGILSVSVPTAKPGGHGDDVLEIPLSPSEVEAIGR